MVGTGTHCNCMEGKAVQNKENTMLTQPLNNTNQTQADYVHHTETQK